MIHLTHFSQKKNKTWFRSQWIVILILVSVVGSALAESTTKTKTASKNTQTPNLQFSQKLKPTYLPINKLQFKSPKRINHLAFDNRDTVLANQIIENINDQKRWPVGYFKEIRKQVTNLVAINARSPESRLHSKDFYDYIRVVLLNKIATNGGFVFHECVSACDEKTHILITNDKLKIHRSQGVSDFIKRHVKDKTIDGILKWQFIAQKDQALLDVRILNSKNEVIWQDVVSAKLEDEFTLQQKKSTDVRQNRLSLGLKSQTINFTSNEGEQFKSDLVWLLNYGIKDTFRTFDNMRYYIGTRVQMNAQTVNRFAYLNFGLDARIGYKLNTTHRDDLVLYAILAQDFAIAAGLNMGALLEWSISDEYSLGMGYEIPITTDRSISSTAGSFNVEEGFWFEISSQL